MNKNRKKYKRKEKIYISKDRLFVELKPDIVVTNKDGEIVNYIEIKTGPNRSIHNENLDNRQKYIDALKINLESLERMGIVIKEDSKEETSIYF